METNEQHVAEVMRQKAELGIDCPPIDPAQVEILEGAACELCGAHEGDVVLRYTCDSNVLACPACRTKYDDEAFAEANDAAEARPYCYGCGDQTAGPCCGPTVMATSGPEALATELASEAV